MNEVDPGRVTAEIGTLIYRFAVLGLLLAILLRRG